jgi:hypothetical protein
MTPYQVFFEAVKDDPEKTFRDVWRDFAIWEGARGFGDDPSAQSREALAWVRSMDELARQLDDYEGDAKENCKDALDAAFVSFAKLEHGEELCNAARLWRQWRLDERADDGNNKTIDSDGVHD